VARPLNDEEIADLLTSDTVARLATIDASGYPHVTPLWFLWADRAFHFASDSGRPHLSRLQANPQVGLVIDVEAEQRPDGQRPNKQLRATGDATLCPDTEAVWTRRIWDKYIVVSEPTGEATARLGDRQRVLIRIVPRRIVAVASV